MDPAMAVAVVTAVIGAVGTVLAAWIQSRARRGRTGNVPGPEKESILHPAGDETDTTAGPESSGDH